MDDLERALRQYDKLGVSAAEGIAQKLAKHDALMRDATKSLSQRLAEQDRAWRMASQGIVDRLNEQNARLSATALEGIERNYQQAVRNINVRAMAGAEKLVNDAIRKNDLLRIRATGLLGTTGAAAVLERAVKASVAPHTQELLARASEALRDHEAAMEYVEADTDLWLDESSEGPLLAWLREFDRATLAFLFRILLVTSITLKVTIGVAIALEDREIDIEELGTLLEAVELLAAYALWALRDKNKDD